MTQGLGQSSEWWKVGNFSSSKVSFIYSLLLSLKVSTTGSPGAEQLNTGGIHLFTTLFLQLSQRVLLPVVPVCFKWPLVKEIPQPRNPEVQGMGNGFALLLGIKQWCLCGWNKCVWDVCLDAPGPVWYLLPFLMLWPWRGLGIKCKYDGDNVAGGEVLSPAPCPTAQLAALVRPGRGPGRKRS